MILHRARPFFIFCLNLLFYFINFSLHAGLMLRLISFGLSESSILFEVGISKLGVLMHFGMAECRVPFLGPCDLDV